MPTNPDELAELRKTVEIYENEYYQIASKIGSRYSPEQIQKNEGAFILENARSMEMSRKLIEAYRKYVAKLESIIPR